MEGAGVGGVSTWRLVTGKDKMIVRDELESVCLGGMNVVNTWLGERQIGHGRQRSCWKRNMNGWKVVRLDAVFREEQ